MPEPVEELRAVVQSTARAPEAMQPYLRKVHECAFTITDADVDALKSAGCTEDEIFEQTVSAAIAEGLRRLDRAREVLS
jgi:alkylhydroperoxidase family enzyme